MNFWIKEHAVIRCSLVHNLPDNFIRDIKLDKYFNALNRNHYLKNLHNEVKIALALKMYTLHYNQGDVILKQNESLLGMIYIAKGVVQLVSPDDIESPIIMFEYGTSIGSTSMLNPIPMPSQVIQPSAIISRDPFYPWHSTAPAVCFVFQLVATTYCHIHKLDTVDFWSTLAQCYKLKPSRPIFETNKVNKR